MGKRVLMVDDAPMVRAMIADAVAELGFEVIGEAGDGAEAVRMVETLAPDIVLLDVEMPVMSGPAALKAIKKARPETIVLMVTSLDASGLIDDCLLNGAEDYIRKDGLEDLADRLRPYG